MTNTSIWKVVISGALALICISMVQGFWLKNTLDLSARAFDEKVRIAIRNVALDISRMSQVQLPAFNLINQVSQNYYVVNIRDAIDANSLEYYLTRELEAVSLRTDFEYGIYDCNTDQMVYGNYIHAPGRRRSEIRASKLPTYDEFVYYFGIRFPDRKSYLLSNQWLPLVFTGILLLAMVFFIYATSEIYRQKKLSDLQKDFINNMTHEFKTPLTSIRVSSEVFLKESLVKANPRLKRYAQIIHDQTQRLNGQIERVLQIADASAKPLELKIEPVQLHQLIIQIAGQVRSRLDQRNGKIELHLDASNDLIRADLLHMANILSNLIDNALKYSPKDPLIVVSTEHRDHNLLLQIKDQGIGVDQKYLGKLSNKFFRVPTGDVHNVKGFGLGLHYVLQMVQAHGWSMNIKSKPNEGTSVTIEIQNQNE